MARAIELRLIIGTAIWLAILLYVALHAVTGFQSQRFHVNPMAPASCVHMVMAPDDDVPGKLDVSQEWCGS